MTNEVKDMKTKGMNIINNELYFGNFKASDLAKEYKTPLYVMDENRIRENIRSIKTSLKKYFKENSQILFASKACDFMEIEGRCQQYDR